MSYVINNTRGQIVAIVPDGTINTSATPVTLVGRGVTSYGAYENENYVWILENFANSSAPPNPIVGQLWYNTSTDTISVWNTGNAWATLADVSYVSNSIADAKVSPVFTGIPVAPTAAANTATTQIATTAFVATAISNLSGNVTGNFAPINSPSFTGVPVAPTPVNSDNSGKIATTAFVQAQKDSPVFTGVPIAPTAANATSNTQIATTAFVQAQKVSPVFTGIPVAPTPDASAADTQIATTAFVSTAISNFSGNVSGNFAPINSPIFTGTPQAPTPPSTDNSIRMATTSFVQAQKNNPVFTGVPVAPTAANSTANTQIATTEFVSSSITNLTTSLGGVFAPINSPIFTGTPQAPTPPSTDNNIRIATTAFVQAQKIDPVFTGIPLAPTPAPAAANNQIATTAFVSNAVATATTNLGTMSTQNSNAVSITGGSITGITALSVSFGGTGAINPTAARTNLGAASVTTTISAGAGLTGGGTLGSNMTIAIASNSNGYGNRYVSTSTPSGGSNGDVWYQI